MGQTVNRNNKRYNSFYDNTRVVVLKNKIILK